MECSALPVERGRFASCCDNSNSEGNSDPGLSDAELVEVVGLL